MKKCRTIPQLISRYIDGDLTSAESRMVTSHLAECGKCHRLYESFILQKELVTSSFSEQPLPVAILPMLSRKRENAYVTRFAPFLRYGLAVSVLIILSGISIFHLLRNSTSREITLQPRIILESTTPSSMASPLSALVYYDEFAGNTVHSQFIRFSPQQSSAGSISSRERILRSGYDSPLFYDNSVLLQQYKGVSNVSGN